MFDEDTNKGNDYEKKAMLSKFSVGRSHLMALNAAVVSSMVGLDYLAKGARLAHIFMSTIVSAAVPLCLVELQRHGAVLLLSALLHTMPCSHDQCDMLCALKLEQSMCCSLKRASDITPYMCCNCCHKSDLYVA